MLARLTAVLEQAEAGGFAVGAFNVFNLESMQGVVAGAEKEGLPVILMLYSSLTESMGVSASAAIARAVADSAEVPVVVHLDHSRDEGLALECARSGYTSVMFDGSRLPLAENIAKTRQVVDTAHRLGVDVEAELGYVGLGTDARPEEAEMTSPEEALQFVAETGVDALAVAIGNAHGLYTREPDLDLTRLEQIAEAVDIPLVLHGGTGVSDEDIRCSVATGIRKINVGTGLNLAMGAAIQDAFATDESGSALKAGRAAREAACSFVRDRLRVFTTTG